MMAKIDTKFHDYCLQNLNADEFNSLYEDTKKTKTVIKYHITRAFNYPRQMKADTVKYFAKKLNVPSKELVEKYKCGFDVLTVSEYFDMYENPSL